MILLSFPLALSAWWPVLRWVTILGDLALALLFIIDWRLLADAGHISAERECPDILSLGARNPVRLRLRSRAPRAFRLTVVDDPPLPFGFSAGRAKGRLPAHGEWATTYDLTPDQRGDYEFGDLHVRVTTDLGLAFRQRTFELGRPVRVYPNMVQLRQHELLARRDRLALIGVHRLRLPSASMEFDSLRDYMPDDELRRVDWKATARRGKLVVKEYHVARMQTVVVLLDCGRTMASHLEGFTKLDYAINATVLLTHVAAGMDDRVGVLAFADEVLGYQPPGKGKTQAARVIDFLYPLGARAAEADYRRAFAFLSARQQRRALVVVFTDLIDPDSSRRLLAYLPLLARRHHVLCVALSDWELGRLLREAPADTRELFQQTVALSLQEDRGRALAQMSARGVTVLNAAPSDLSVATVNSYLALKRTGAI